MAPFGKIDRKALRALFGCAIAIGVVIAGSTGQALAQDDDDDESWDTKMMHNVLRGLGLRNGQEAGIEYHERSPLVVPPTRVLPTPQTPGATPTNPAWPRDVDVAARKAAKKKKQTAAVPSEEEDMRQLRPDELRGTPGTPRAPVDPNAPPIVAAGDEPYRPSKPPSNIFSSIFNFGRDTDETVQFTGEPPRAALTEPPAGLRTPSPKYPYGTKGGMATDKGGAVDTQALRGQ